MQSIPPGVTVRPMGGRSLTAHQEEDATHLSLGADFQNAHTLFSAEVAILLKQIQQDRQQATESNAYGFQNQQSSTSSSVPP